MTNPANSADRIVAPTRRLCCVAALVGLLAACGGSDDSANDASTTTTDASAATATTADDTGSTTTAPTPTTVTDSAPAATATPTTAAPTTAAPTTAPSTTATDTAPGTIPEAVRGVWRESEAASVTAAECDDTNSSENMGKVLNIRADGFSNFETGGRLLEVFESDASRIDARYDTTYADTPTEERITFDAQDDGNVLIVRDESRPGPVRYVRCPASDGDGSQPTGAPLELQPFGTDLIAASLGGDAIGCSLQSDQASDLDIVFFVNDQGGLIMIDGTAIVLANSTTTDDSVIPDIAVGLTYSDNGYAATFAAVGPEREDSIESTERDVTLAVSTPDNRFTSVDGLLFCGV